MAARSTAKNTISMLKKFQRGAALHRNKPWFHGKLSDLAVS
jgi:hypothetical protein